MPWEFGVEVGPYTLIPITSRSLCYWVGWIAILIDSTIIRRRAIIRFQHSFPLTEGAGPPPIQAIHHLPSLCRLGHCWHQAHSTISYHAPASTGELLGMNHFFDLMGTQTNSQYLDADR